MIFTDFINGKVRVTCLKGEPTLVLVELDNRVKAIPFETGVGSKVFKINFTPKSIRFTGMDYIPIEKADKPLKQGEHRTPPKGYPKKQSDYAGPHYDFPVDTEKHVRAALAYFTKHKWGPGEKGPAARKILRAAKKFGVKVSKDDAVYRAAH